MYPFSTFRSLCLLSLVLFILTGCRTKNTGRSTIIHQTKDSTVIRIQEGEQFFLADEQFNVTFSQVLEDSRCPEGVNCVWEGIAAVELTLTGTYTRPQTVKIATYNLPSKNYSSTCNFNHYTLRLLKLEPYPKERLKKGRTDRYTAFISIH
ncbi:hypothetical protein [Sphingobacterium sp. LRF_L2]|uniref:hypothetical protein n=1 Tax=Sphingobacterium sp. LRF_L2 TaxID=3369421 RepID=UPI003F5EF722